MNIMESGVPTGQHAAESTAQDPMTTPTPAQPATAGRARGTVPPGSQGGATPPGFQGGPPPTPPTYPQGG